MKRFLLSTALTTILAGAVIGGQVTASFAQTEVAATSETPMIVGMENFIAPDGFTRSEGQNSMSIEALQGATIYDPAGNQIGKISDLVLTTATPDTASDATMGASTSDATTGTDSTTGMAADGTATGTTGTDSTTGMAADGTTTGTESTGTDSTTGMAADGTATDGTGTDSATSMAADTTAAGTTATGTADSTTTAAVPEEGTLVGSQITHVVVDSGGFLGMGVHTVALPIEALVIYANANDDYRIYLPWTKDQLRDLPNYNKDDPSTLSTGTTTN